MIFRLLWRTAVKLAFLLAILVILLTGISRATQPPMQPLSYILERQSLYYTPQTSCASFFEKCSISSRKLLEGLYSFPVASWSPDGQYVAIHLQNSWAVYPADCLLKNPDCTPSLLDPTINNVRPAWGPDGAAIAFVDYTAKNITLLSRGCWDTPSQSACFQQARALTTFINIQQPDWSADGRYMVFSEYSISRFMLFDMICLNDPAGCLNYAKELPVRQFTQTAWPSLSPDNRTILYAGASDPNGTHQTLFLLDIQTDTSHPITSLTISGYPDWSADGHYIAFVGYNDFPDHDVKLYLLDVTRGLTQQFLHVPGQNLNFPVWASAP